LDHLGGHGLWPLVRFLGWCCRHCGIRATWASYAQESPAGGNYKKRRSRSGRGLGVPVDAQKAVLWVRKAANQGLIQAEHAYGVYLQAAASAIGGQIEILAASTSREIDAAFESLEQKRTEALLISPAALIDRRAQILTARLWLISHIGSSRIFKASVLAAAALLFSSQLALAQFTQQGPKLVGTGAVGVAEQGYSVALSADGNLQVPHYVSRSS
jgi:hypothetical protein